MHGERHIEEVLRVESLSTQNVVVVLVSPLLGVDEIKQKLKEKRRKASSLSSSSSGWGWTVLI